MAEIKEETFLQKLSQLLDGAELTMDTELSYLESWDSLAGVDFIGMVDTEFDEDVDPMSVRTAATVRDLYELACGQGD